MGEASDGYLYRAACSGDRSAFQALAERHHRYTMRVASSLLSHDPAAAEDVAHKSWLNVCRHIKQVEEGHREPLELKHEASFMAWLKTVTTNAANDEFRWQARRSNREIEDEDVIYSPEPSERLIFGEEQSAVWRAFQDLGQGCQELLTLLIEDPPLNYRSIADILGRPIGSIGPTRARCIEQLRARL